LESIREAPPAATSVPPADTAICGRCRSELERTVYEVRVANRRTPRCLRCALIHPPLVARSAFICLVVGTLLTAINQGNVILQGDASLALAWKVPLTYAVPYCVATTGAILNARVRRTPG
jgi:hypothetical protein